jgi:UDP-N-acetylmuramate dehydrogenase
MNLGKIELRHNVSLKKYTTIKIGGVANHLFFVNSIDALFSVINKLEDSFYILGKGSNILIKDHIIKTPVLKLGERFNYIKKNNHLLEVGASTSLSSLIKYCIYNGISGLENLAGIPATIGGMLVMNASSFDREISSFLAKIEVLDKRDKEIKQIDKKEIVFDYRRSSLTDKIILRAWFEFTSIKDSRYVREKVFGFLKKRESTQEIRFPTCGCIFKNPSNFKAGYLIEACGLKGIRKNDALVSFRHANFIVNIGKATYNDVDYLINKIKEKVYSKYKIILEEEIERWT